MSPFHTSYPELLGELSRQKLLRVAESSDTLRRAVLIHNVMRSTASLPPTPTNESHPEFPYSSSSQHLPEEEQPQPQPQSTPVPVPIESSGAPSQAADHFYVFPHSPMTSTTQPQDGGYVHSQEQDWLDSILDDLEDVSVSVVPVDDDDSLTLDDEPTPCIQLPLHHRQSLFSPPSSPPLRPVPPPQSADDFFPGSPPELDLDSDDEGDLFDSDSDGESEDEAVTPSSSTDFSPPSDRYFLRNLPFRNYPGPADHFKPLP